MERNEERSISVRSIRARPRNIRAPDSVWHWPNES